MKAKNAPTNAPIPPTELERQATDAAKARIVYEASKATHAENEAEYFRIATMLQQATEKCDESRDAKGAAYNALQRRLQQLQFHAGAVSESITD